MSWWLSEFITSDSLNLCRMTAGNSHLALCQLLYTCAHRSLYLQCPSCSSACTSMFWGTSTWLALSALQHIPLRQKALGAPQRGIWWRCFGVALPERLLLYFSICLHVFLFERTVQWTIAVLSCTCKDIRFCAQSISSYAFKVLPPKVPKPALDLVDNTI